MGGHETLDELGEEKKMEGTNTMQIFEIQKATHLVSMRSRSKYY